MLFYFILFCTSTNKLALIHFHYYITILDTCLFSLNCNWSFYFHAIFNDQKNQINKFNNTRIEKRSILLHILLPHSIYILSFVNLFYILDYCCPGRSNIYAYNRFSCSALVHHSYPID